MYSSGVNSSKNTSTSIEHNEIRGKHEYNQ